MGSLEKSSLEKSEDAQIIKSMSITMVVIFAVLGSLVVISSHFSGT